MAKRHAYCLVSISPVRSDASDASEIETQLLFGEIIKVHSIEAPWAHITTLSDAYSGYIDHKHLFMLSEKEVKRWMDGLDYLRAREATLMTPWGAQRICRGSHVPVTSGSFNIGPHEFEWKEPSVDIEHSILSYAEDYLNTPYLWGGKSPFGIDCSGITQIIYRLFGMNLPRNASEQVECGMEVSFEDLQAGDLAYFKGKSGKVTHVGILDGNSHIYHASGHVRKDLLTEQGIIHSESGELTHPLHLIKRL